MTLIACNSRGRLLDICLRYASVREAVAGVVTDRDSNSVAVAAKHGLPAFKIDQPNDELLSDAILALCEQHGFRSILSIGYTRLFAGRLLDAYRGRIANSHFSLLPAFPGRRNSDWTAKQYPPRAIFERTLAFGSRFTGNTIHLVDASIDGGKPIIQSVLVIPYDEDPALTRHRLFIQECQCFMQVLIWLAKDRLRLTDSGMTRIVDARFDQLSFSPAIEEPWILAFSHPLEHGT